MKEEKEYKSLHSPLREQIKKDLEENLDKFKDPIVIGEMVYRLLEERENTNRIIKTLIAKIENLEQKIENKNKKRTTESLLSEPDQRIIELIKKMGQVTARDVQKKLGYRGTNGASMRLNKLYREGLLEKMQVGKKVYYTLK